VAVMDIRMPVQDGIAATAQIAAEELARVLVLTTFHLDEYVIAALRDHLLTKLDVRDRVQLVIFAYDAGLAGSPS
jgi:DNA-binding NarL/FixJ family response regulator